MKTFYWNQLTAAQQTEVLTRPATPTASDYSVIQNILTAVREKGDAAVKQFTAQFDQVHLNQLQITAAEFAAAEKNISSTAKEAITQAAKNLRTFHQPQIPANYRVEVTPGVVCEMQMRPLSRVGLYIPGGSAPLISTALMLGIPALLAGCPLRILCSPPSRDGSLDPHILYAAKLCGIEQVYKMGGAQAIAAFAYGTESVPKVDKIFGPGNRWVTQAKILVAQDPQGAAYDLPAGPSEQMLIADDSARPEFAAADLLSQAEHSPDAQVILLAIHENLAQKIIAAIQKQLPTRSRRDIIMQSLQKSAAIIVANLDEAVQIANRYAPEHLLLQITQPRDHLSQINTAGSVFLGNWTPESVGDYASGTNHVLPTYGFAHSHSGVGVMDFMRRMTVQELSQAGLRQLAPTVKTLTELEKLDAHGYAVTVRNQEKINTSKNKDLYA